MAKKKAPVEPAIIPFKNADDYVSQAMYNADNSNGAGDGGNAEIVKIIEAVFSENNIDQKSFLSEIQIEGLIELDAFIMYDVATYGFIDRVQYGIAKDTVVKAKNLNGFGMEKLVQLFQPIYDRVKQNESIKNSVKIIQ